MSGLQFDPPSFAPTLQLLGTHGLLLSAERYGQVVGIGAIDVASAFWNRRIKVAQKQFWSMRPEHRSGHGGRLLRALEHLARARGTRLFQDVAEEGDRSKALGRLYRSMGYPSQRPRSAKPFVLPRRQQ